MNVRYTIICNEHSVSFSDLAELTNNLCREQIHHRLLEWSQSVRALGLRAIISQKTTEEIAQAAKILFDEKNNPT